MTPDPRIAELAAENARLKLEVSDLEAGFELRWKADTRAIKRWHAANPGRELTLPDHADLCVWLINELEKWSPRR